MSTHDKAPRPNDPPTADSVQRKRIEWLWRNRFPKGMLSLVAGRPGQGKSLFAAMLAAEVSKKGDVIFSNREDPLAQVVRPRLEAAGANLSRIHFYSPTLPDDLPALEKQIRRTKAKLVILDPAASHLRPSMFNDQDVRTALAPAAEIAERTLCSILMISHTVKYVSSKAHALTAIGGSGGGMTGAARAIFLFGVDPADTTQRALVPVKFNIGPKPLAITFELDEIEFYDSRDRIESVAGRLIVVSDKENINPLSVLLDPDAARVTGPGAEKREAAAEWLTNYLSLGPRPTNDIREDAIQTGVSWATLRRSSVDLEIEKFKERKANGQWMWALPIGHPALLVDDDEEDPLEGLIAKEDGDG
jgi:putative DNA primase/helicase